MTCGGTGGEKIASRKATRAAAREAGALMGGAGGRSVVHPQRKQKLKLTLKGIEGGRLKANKVLCARAQASCSPTVALPEGIPLPPPLQCRRRLALYLITRQRAHCRAGDQGQSWNETISATRCCIATHWTSRQLRLINMVKLLLLSSSRASAASSPFFSQASFCIFFI